MYKAYIALHFFDIYVAKAGGPTGVFMDHNLLTFLHMLKNKNQRPIQWYLLLHSISNNNYIYS